MSCKPGCLHGYSFAIRSHFPELQLRGNRRIRRLHNSPLHHLLAMLRHLSHFNRLFKQTRSRSISAIALLRNQTVDSTATCYSKIDCPTGAPSFDHLIANILSAVDEDGYDNFQLNQVRSNVTKWLVEAPVWDREELITKLQSIMADKGRFACVLGGTSVGKSFVVRKLSKDKTKNILYVNMRFESDLQKAILIAMAYSPNHSIVAEAIKSIMDNPDCIGKESRTEAVSSTGKIDHALGNMLARAFANPNIADSAANTLGRLLVENMSAESVDKSLVDMARSLGNLTVIVDAANIAFDSEYSVDLKTSRSAQALLSAMTKENTMVRSIDSVLAFPGLTVCASSSMSSSYQANTHFRSCSKTKCPSNSPTSTSSSLWVRYLQVKCSSC